jgi:hypothetical protein
MAFTTSALTIIEGIAGKQSQFAIRANDVVASSGGGHYYAVADVHAVLLALRDDLRDGNLRGLSDLVRGEAFADFLEMAEHLLVEGYRDAAAVIAGSVLEGHLRALAGNREIATTKENGSAVSADRLNGDLRTAGAYSSIDQKSVTAWLGIRNDAAHGRYENYDDGQVKMLTLGVRDFLGRVPA